MASAIEDLLNQMRHQCLSKGCGGIKELSVVFRRMDIDFSKRISLKEFENGLRMYGINLSDANFKLLFSTLDRDSSGAIDFSEFITNLRPHMNSCRRRVVNEAFDKLDVNKDGVLKVDDLQVVYSANAQKHPMYLSGEMTLEEVLRNFIDTMDTPGCPDGKVTRDEFLNYYSGVSATIDDDCYFDLMMRNCYALPQRGHKKE